MLIYACFIWYDKRKRIKAMEIEVKIKSSDILTEEEIKEIVSNEIRKQTKEYFFYNQKNGCSNLAFYIKEHILQESISEHIEEIKVKFKAQLDKFKFSSYDLDKNDLFDTSIPKKVNIQSSRSGDPYDGNPPASKEEQKERMKYIRSVYNKEYNDGNHDESIYTIYLYTSHYIENIGL